MATPGNTDSDGAVNEESLFWAVQRVAEQRYPARKGQGMPPSGARIAYFTRLALLRQDPHARLEFDARPLADSLAQDFLRLAPRIARRLAIDFKRVVRLMNLKHAPQESQQELQRLLHHHPLLTAPPLTWAPDHLAGLAEPLRQRWQDLWRACWQHAEPQHRGRLRTVLRPHLLLAIPVAAASTNGKAALELLRQQLKQDRKNRTWLIPPPATFLYDEPLEEWLLRPLLSGQWLFRLCGALAELTRAVPALARQRAAELGVTATDDATWQQQVAALEPEVRRRLPTLPQGSITAEALFYYAVSAGRVSAGEAARAAGENAEIQFPQAASPVGKAGDEPIFRDTRLLPPAQFRALLALAVQAAEHLLWDDTLPIRALPDQAPERSYLLRQALLPPRLRKYQAKLAGKEQWRRLRAQAAPLPPWVEWEAPLQATIDNLNKRLTTAVSPAAITSATLDTLLSTPRATLVGQYLYQSTLGAWLRAALPADLPGGAALLQFCQQITLALGEWPPGVPGAPASAEQAGLAVCYFTKLALEARIDRAPDPPAALPRRQDGGLVVWVGAPLPPEALELATVIAPLIARVLYQSAWEAANQDKPILALRLKEGEQASIARINWQLWRQARDKSHPDASEAVFVAWQKLNHQLEHLVLPAEVSLPLLSGNSSLSSLDFEGMEWYTFNRNSYQFLGSLASFACSFIHFAKTTRQIPYNQADDQIEAPGEAEDPQADTTAADDEAALKVLALIVQIAQGRLPSPETGELEPQDGLRLVQAIVSNHSGRELINTFIRQGEPVAMKISRLWQASSPLAQVAEPVIVPSADAERLKQNVAVARLLAYNDVMESPAMRRAVADLFELPMSIESGQPSLRLPLSSLERRAGWVSRSSLRTQVLRALAALEPLPEVERRALCTRLLAQESIVLLLALLEQTGWTRPSWLSIPAPEAAEETAIAWLDDEPGERARAWGSPQIFQVARLNWLSQVSRSAPGSAWLARALIAELSDTHPWSSSWERLLQPPIQRFFKTLLFALHPSLGAVLRAAWVVAHQKKLAHLTEVVGLTGCLYPQLPAQLDHPTFFTAMLEVLESMSEAPLRDMAEEEEEEEEEAWQAVRQKFLAARCRTAFWFLALAGVETEYERKTLLAAMSLAKGNPARLGQWIEGQSPSPAEVQALYDEIKHWHHQTAITRQSIPTLLRSATAQIRSAWRQLRSVPLAHY